MKQIKCVAHLSKAPKVGKIIYFHQFVGIEKAEEIEVAI